MGKVKLKVTREDAIHIVNNPPEWMLEENVNTIIIFGSDVETLWVDTLDGESYMVELKGQSSFMTINNKLCVIHKPNELIKSDNINELKKLGKFIILENVSYDYISEYQIFRVELEDIKQCLGDNAIYDKENDYYIIK